MSNKQIHKRLDQKQVETILESYLATEITLNTAFNKLGLKRSQFFKILKEYKEHPEQFNIEYKRNYSNRKISNVTEKKILNELKKEKELIENKNIPIRNYNYSSIRDTLEEKYNISVSVPTIIKRAKAKGYYLGKVKRKIHDREVLTNFIGELVQHDSSYHLFSPYMEEKIYLITSLDDYSRLLLFADFFKKETAWSHILALKSVFLQYGCPLKYYSDQHSIFRFVKDRDKNSPWKSFSKYTDDVSPQWKQVLELCNVGVTYALSPQAKGKIERPYRWLQDRIVRIAAKEKITKIDELRNVLKNVVYKYNNTWIHSTTKEIPVVRFEKALHFEKGLFKKFKIPKPYKDVNDIFCLQAERVIDSYRKISLHGIEIRVPNGIPRKKVKIKIVPDFQNNIAEVRFWQGNMFLGKQNVSLKNFPIVRF